MGHIFVRFGTTLHTTLYSNGPSQMLAPPDSPPPPGLVTEHPSPVPLTARLSPPISTSSYNLHGHRHNNETKAY